MPNLGQLPPRTGGAVGRPPLNLSAFGNPPPTPRDQGNPPHSGRQFSQRFARLSPTVGSSGMDNGAFEGRSHPALDSARMISNLDSARELSSKPGVRQQGGRSASKIASSPLTPAGLTDQEWLSMLMTEPTAMELSDQAAMKARVLDLQRYIMELEDRYERSLEAKERQVARLAQGLAAPTDTTGAAWAATAPAPSTSHGIQPSAAMAAQASYYPYPNMPPPPSYAEVSATNKWLSKPSGAAAGPTKEFGVQMGTSQLTPGYHHLTPRAATSDVGSISARVRLVMHSTTGPSTTTPTTVPSGGTIASSSGASGVATPTATGANRYGATTGATTAPRTTPGIRYSTGPSTTTTGRNVSPATSIRRKPVNVAVGGKPAQVSNNPTDGRQPPSTPRGNAVPPAPRMQPPPLNIPRPTH